MAGTPTVTRVDSVIDLQLTHPEPAALIAPPGMRDFSARWTGFLTPSESGTYEFGLVGSMHQLWLDGKLIADDLVLHDPNPSTKVVQFEKGHRYAIKIEYARGAFGTKLVWLNMLADPIADAVAVAKQADAVVAVVGITSQLEGEEMKVEVPGFKGGDRTSLDLPKEEEDLLEALAATGKPLIEKGDRIVPEVAFDVSVGGGQPGANVAAAQAHFLVRGEQKLPE